MGQWPIKMKSDSKNDFIKGTILFQDKTGKAKSKESQRKCFTVQRSALRRNFIVAITEKTHISAHGHCVTNACAPTQMHMNTPNIRGVHSLHLKPQATRSANWAWSPSLPTSGSKINDNRNIVCLCMVGGLRGEEKGWRMAGNQPKPTIQPFIQRPSTDTTPTDKNIHSLKMSWTK